MQRAPLAFSLIELAVVLLILSVLVGFGMVMGQNALHSTERAAMQEKMAIIKKTLDAYAERNGYLPCPADPALLPSHSNYGLESRAAAAGGGCQAVAGTVVLNNNVWFGALPLHNLGLDAAFARDSWANKLTYAVSALHVGASASGIHSYAIYPGQIEIRSGTRTGYRVLTTALSTFAVNNGVAGAGATYVVVSHGANQRGAFPAEREAILQSCNSDPLAIDGENCDRTNNVFFDSPYHTSTNETLAFDDYVAWGTNILRRNPLRPLANACPSIVPGVPVCEAWCAPCATTGMSAAPITNPPDQRLCAKFVTKNTNDCEAVCLWSGAMNPC